MAQFIVGIGQYEYHSDNGTTWRRALRELPPKRSPIVKGPVDLASLPVRPGIAIWDFATVLPHGLGAVVGHDVIGDMKRRASVFVTNDGGRNWRRQLFESLYVSAQSWPVEQFSSLVIKAPSTIAIAWDDPCVYYSPQAHVIFSQDEGYSWTYSSLGDANPYVTLAGDGRVLALNNGYFLETFDLSERWQKSEFELDWPDKFDKNRVALLRQVTFLSAHVGYALVVHWMRGFFPEAPVEVGFVITENGGANWRHLHVFDGPNVGDVNERHILDLRVVDVRILGNYHSITD